VAAGHVQCQRRRVRHPLAGISLSVNAGLRLGLLGLTALTISLGLFGLAQIDSVYSRADEIGRVRSPNIVVIGDIARLQQEYRAGQFRHASTPTLGEMDILEVHLAALATNIDELFAQYRATQTIDQADADKLQQAQASWAAYLTTNDAFLTRSRAMATDAMAGSRENSLQVFALLTGKAEALFIENGQVVTAWRDLNEQLLKQGLDAAAATRDSSTVLIALFTALIAMGGVAITVMTDRTIRKYRWRTDALVDDSKQAADRALLFNRLAERATFASDEEELVGAATSTLRRLVPSPAGDLLLLNASTDRLLVAGAWNGGEEKHGGLVAIDRPTLCPGIRRGSVYYLSDATDDLLVRCPAHPVTEGSMLCVPMLALGQTVGVLHLARRDPDAFSIGEQQLASRMAEQAALSLANARLMKVMESQAMTDALTGLPNARFFDPTLERELAAAERDHKPLSVVMVDIDHFKKFNDSYGHPGGDEALKSFAATMRAMLRQSDSAARYGGEEFAILLRHADLGAAVKFTEDLRRAVEASTIYIGPGRFARVTASFGVASSAVHGGDRMTLMRMADQALYQAKEQGRNRVVAAESSPAEAVEASSSGNGRSSARRGKLRSVATDQAAVKRPMRGVEAG
jgi:diguanylate cyclase (GGDEF)-like protein